MAISAFKSTSKRGSCANAGTSSSARQHQSEDAGRKVPSRRSRSVSAVSRTRLEEPAPMLEFLNKRDNPLFCTSSASPTDSEKSVGVAEKGGDDASGCRRGRSTSRTSGSLHSQQSGQKKDCGRSLSRVDIGRRRRSVSKDHYGKPESNGQVSTWDDGISTSSFSETEEKTIKAVFEQMKSFQNEHPISDSGSGIYETVRTEVRRAMADIRSDLENAIHVRDVPVSTLSNGFHSPSEMVGPDAIELVADIRREYAIKLQESQERARKLRANLDVEVQCSQGLSKILKEMVPDPKCNEMQCSLSKRKTSIERHKMSRRLTEEAMNYFDECVSISTFDTSDISSPEDQLPSAVDDNMPWCNSNMIENNDSSSSSVCVASNPVNRTEVVSDQSRTLFSFSRKSMASVATHDLKNYVSRFGKELQERDDHSNVRSSYNGDDYETSTSEESLLFEKTILRHRIEAGCLLICDVRTF